MEITLYLVHGSHPCDAAAKALELKGLPFRVREWPPPLHAPLQKLIFGQRTVPALKIDNRKICGSSAIFHELDRLVPDPLLFPSDPDQHKAVSDAEQWGAGDFQQVPRDLLWAAMRHRPDALVSYSAHSRLKLPAAAVRANAPLIARAEAALNHTDDVVARRRLAQLPDLLDKVDGWIKDGTIGQRGAPNAADLQLLATVRLLETLADLQPLLEDRPCRSAALALFPDHDGYMPAGSVADPIG